MGKQNNKAKRKELIEVKELMEREKVCGYQELLVKKYVEDIRAEI